MESTILARLEGDAPLTALVGTRIYAGSLPQDPTYPCVLFVNTSQNPINALSGEADLKNDNYQVTAYSKTYDEARSVLAAASAAIAPFGPDLAAVRVGGSPAYEDDAKIWQKSNDYSIWKR